MQYLRADTITEVTIGPAVAVGDGFTPVTSLVGASADEFEIVKHGATATTTIAGTLAAITGADGYYALDLSATDTNTEGRLTLLINDDSLILPIRHEFMVVNANVFDSLFAAAGTDLLQVDQTQIVGDAVPTPAVTGIPDVNALYIADGLIPAPIVAGVPDVNPTYWRDGLIPTQNVAGVPEVDTTLHRGTVVPVPSSPGTPAVEVTRWGAGAVPTPTTAGVPDVNVERWLDTLVTLGSGAPDVNIQSIDTDAIGAAALAATGINKIRDAILPEQNVALPNIPFVFVLASDGRTVVTGATGMSAERSIDAGAFGAGTGTMAEISDGAYQYDASAADLNGGIITFKFSATGGTPGVPADTFLTIVTGGGV